MISSRAVVASGLRCIMDHRHKNIAADDFIRVSQGYRVEQTPKQSGQSLTGGAIHCIGCQYDLAGTPVGGMCPECGRPVRDTFARHQDPLSSSTAVAALVLGILSIACLPLLGPVALWVGHTAHKEINAGRAPKSSSIMATIGQVLGALTTIICILWIVVIVLDIAGWMP